MEAGQVKRATEPSSGEEKEGFVRSTMSWAQEWVRRKSMVRGAPDLEIDYNTGAKIMYHALMANKPDVVEYLLQNGVDPSESLEDAGGKTPLIMAVLTGNIESVAILLAHGADIHGVNQQGQNALMLAVQQGKPDIVECLLRHGANIHGARDENGESVMSLATKKKMFILDDADCEILNLLLSWGGDVNERDGKGFTLLMRALEERYTPVIQWLLDNGADVNAADIFGNTPLLLAVSNYFPGPDEIIPLLRHGADAARPNKMGNTPIDIVLQGEKITPFIALAAEGALDKIPEEVFVQKIRAAEIKNRNKGSFPDGNITGGICLIAAAVYSSSYCSELLKDVYERWGIMKSLFAIIKKPFIDLLSPEIKERILAAAYLGDFGKEYPISSKSDFVDMVSIVLEVIDVKPETACLFVKKRLLESIRKYESDNIPELEVLVAKMSPYLKSFVKRSPPF